MAELYLENNYNTKYIYRNNESDEEMFIFEIILKKKNNKFTKIRKIKKSRFGMLLSSNDKIDYADLTYVKISAIDINNPIKEIIVEYEINQNNRHNIIFNNNIFIEFFNNNFFLESKYNIMDI